MAHVHWPLLSSHSTAAWVSWVRFGLPHVPASAGTITARPSPRGGSAALREPERPAQGHGVRRPEAHRSVPASLKMNLGVFAYSPEKVYSSLRVYTPQARYDIVCRLVARS